LTRKRIYHSPLVDIIALESSESSFRNSYAPPDDMRGFVMKVLTSGLYRLVLREIRLILVTILRRFEISLVEGQSHEVLVSTTPGMA